MNVARATLTKAPKKDDDSCGLLRKSYESAKAYSHDVGCQAPIQEGHVGRLLRGSGLLKAIAHILHAFPYQRFKFQNLCTREEWLKSTASKLVEF
jgi:hypothetical protein